MSNLEERIIPADGKETRYDTVMLDIECVKVPAANWYIKTRFKTVMVGLAYWKDEDNFVVHQIAGEEGELLERVGEILSVLENDGIDKVAIDATRAFDVEVLAGRWVYARRALAEKKGNWPTLDLRELGFEIRNIKFECKRMGVEYPARDKNDPKDCQSVDVLTIWKSQPERVWYHNLLDMLEMVTMFNQICN